MINRRHFIRALSSFGFSLAILPLAVRSASFAAPALSTFDKDNDGTLDAAEVKDAAAGVFDKLEKDADGTLDAKELAGRLDRKAFKEADPDHDGTLTKDEYLAFVEKRFTAADPDKDGTLTEKELHSKAGRALMRLIR